MLVEKCQKVCYAKRKENILLVKQMALVPESKKLTFTPLAKYGMTTYLNYTLEESQLEDDDIEKLIEWRDNVSDAYLNTLPGYLFDRVHNGKFMEYVFKYGVYVISKSRAA